MIDQIVPARTETTNTDEATNQPKVTSTDQTPIYLTDIKLSEGKMYKIYKVPSTPTYTYRTYTITVPENWIVESDNLGEQNVYIRNDDNEISIMQLPIQASVCFYDDNGESNDPDAIGTKSDYVNIKTIDGYFVRYPVKSGNINSKKFKICGLSQGDYEKSMAAPTQVGAITINISSQNANAKLKEIDTILSQINISD